jgi:hypothetical protein
MQPHELVSAKINAALRILEWARGDIEPGISGTPEKAHIALAEAFREIYLIVEDTIPSGRAEAPSAPAEAPSAPAEATATPIGEGQSG